MNTQTILICGILSVTLFVPIISADFLTFALPSASGQDVIFDGIHKGSRDGSETDTTSNKIMTNDNIVPISTTAGNNNSSSTPSSTMNQTAPRITVVDVINSTYMAPTAVDEDDSERTISRAIRDRINDVVHTVVMGNATIISNATITNAFTNESTTINNQTRLLEIIPDHVEVALAGIRARSQASNALVELHTDIETTCLANNTSLADCEINIKIR